MIVTFQFLTMILKVKNTTMCTYLYRVTTKYFRTTSYTECTNIPITINFSNTYWWILSYGTIEHQTTQLVKVFFKYLSNTVMSIESNNIGIIYGFHSSTKCIPNWVSGNNHPINFHIAILTIDKFQDIFVVLYFYLLPFR